MRSGSTNVAIFDMTSDAGETFAAEIGSSAKFFRCDVSDTSSIAKAVQGAAHWAQQTARPLGGVVSAAGISLPATVRLTWCTLRP